MNVGYKLGAVQIWSARDFKPVKTLAGHESKVAGVDVSAGEFSESSLWSVRVS